MPALPGSRPTFEPALGYLAVAIGLGAVFLCLAMRLRSSMTPGRAALLFHYSLLYLALLFTAMALDVVL